MHFTISRTLPPALLLLVLWLVTAGTAGAATYAVDACQHPDGTRTFTDGWVPSWNGNATTTNTCSNGGALGGRWLPANSHSTDEFAQWAFAAPKGTFIDAISGQRQSSAAPRADSATPITFIRGDGAYFEQCGSPLACSTRSGDFSFDVGPARDVSFGVACVHPSAGTCPAGDTSISASRLRVTLRDEDAPKFASAPTGSLTDPATTARLRGVSWSASDVGGGLYRQRLLSDGVEVASAPVDVNGGACVRYPVGNGFVSPVPCKLSASGDMSLDTAALADGGHQVTLEVLDATDQNRASATWPVTIDNVPPAIGGVDVDGVAVEGQTLRCAATVAGQGTRLTYEWLRAAADGSGAVPIPGATSSSYLVGAQDVGRRLLCRVTATDGGGTATSTSAYDAGPFSGGVVAGKDSAAGTTSEAPGGAPRTPGGQPLAPLPSCATATVVLSNASRNLLRTYRRSGMTLTGRLTETSDGHGLGATSLEVLQTVTRAGTSRRTKVATGRTLADGSFSIKVPLGPTRVLELRDPACGAVGPQVAQRVRGAISARTTTRRIRNGQTARIRGKVLGGQLGRGLPLELQVKIGRTWRDVKATTSDAKGNFRVSYRFRRTFVRYTYRFRVVSRGGSAWPYLRASSAQVKVRVN